MMGACEGKVVGRREFFLRVNTAFPWGKGQARSRSVVKCEKMKPYGIKKKPAVNVRSVIVQHPSI